MIFPQLFSLTTAIQLRYESITCHQSIREMNTHIYRTRETETLLIPFLYLLELGKKYQRRWIYDQSMNWMRNRSAGTRYWGRRYRRWVQMLVLLLFFSPIQELGDKMLASSANKIRVSVSFQYYLQILFILV